MSKRPIPSTSAISDEKSLGQSISAKKTKKEQVFLERYKKIAGIEPSSLGSTFARCLFCKSDFSISHSGVYDIERHCKKQKHKLQESAAKSASMCTSITKFMPSQTVKREEESVIRAEVMLTELVVRTNLPLSTADILTQTIKSAFPDSQIAQSYSCCRNKTTAIVNCMATDIKMDLKQKISSGPFSVSTDGSNEQRAKQYPVVITTFGDSGVEQSLLSVPVLDLQSASTGANIYKLLEKELLVNNDTEEPSVPWKNCLSLGCDNAAVMVGHKNGVYAWVAEQQPNLHLAGCPCHLLHRAAQKAASQLPFNIDEVLVDLHYYFDKSSKRLASLELLQAEVKNQKILKHVQTIWLSFGRCLNRLLENWEELVKFFKSEPAPASTSSAQSRIERLKAFFRSPTNKLYCLFLKHALELFDVLNQQLQKEEPQIHILQRSLCKLMRDLMVRFVKPAALVGKTVLDIYFKAKVNQKQLNQILFSDDIRQMIEKKEEHLLRDVRIEEFYRVAQQFYVSALTYIKEKCPVDNELLKHAKVVYTSLRLDGVTDSDLSFFLTRFPCLLPQGCTKDTIMEEFNNYRSHDIIPHLEKDKTDATWCAIGQVKDAVGTPMFSNISKVCLGILTIPHSNAGCERIFSCVRKNKTDQRASLSSQTLDSLMVVKSRPGTPANRKYSNTQLAKFKSAYYKSL